MYQSTPQHIIDEELAPGPVAAWMESSDSDTSSSDSSDSDTSHGSNTTAKKVKRLMRAAGRRPRRKSSGSKETVEGRTRTPSIGNISISPTQADASHDAIDFADDGDDEHPSRRSRNNSIITAQSTRKERKQRAKENKRRKKAARKNGAETITEAEVDGSNKEAKKTETSVEQVDGPRHIDFAVGNTTELPNSFEKRPFTLRGITSTIRPQIPKRLSQNVFSSQAPIPPRTSFISTSPSHQIRSPTYQFPYPIVSIRPTPSQLVLLLKFPQSPPRPLTSQLLPRKTKSISLALQPSFSFSLLQLW